MASSISLSFFPSLFLFSSPFRLRGFLFFLLCGIFPTLPILFFCWFTHSSWKKLGDQIILADFLGEFFLQLNGRLFWSPILSNCIRFVIWLFFVPFCSSVFLRYTVNERALYFRVTFFFFFFPYFPSIPQREVFPSQITLVVC